MYRSTLLYYHVLGEIYHKEFIFEREFLEKGMYRSDALGGQATRMACLQSELKILKY